MEAYGNLNDNVLITFGITGAGKSTMMNFLAGIDDQEPKGKDIPFLVAKTAVSVTSTVNSYTANLMGAGKTVKLVDMPGMQATGGQKKDIDAIDKLHCQCKASFDSKYTNVLVALNSTNRLTENIVNMLKIARCFFPCERMILCFTFDARGKKTVIESYIEELKSTHNMEGWRAVIDVPKEPSESFGQEVGKALHNQNVEIPSFQELDKEKQVIITELLGKIFESKELSYYGREPCFPGSAGILTDRGVVQMNDLQWGSTIQTLNGSQQKQLVMTKYITQLHYSPYIRTQYLRILVEDGSFIDISAIHLIYCFQKGKEASFVQARDVQVGDLLLKGDGNQPMVVQIEDVMLMGQFAPLSSKGTLIVNGFYASCYVGCKLSHKITHRVFKPLIWKNKIKPERQPPHGIHPYCKFLMKSLPQLIEK